ncbi:MAG TPA: YqcI/YcgG family protein, partial [Thermoanaerobaculia bacterium]|nr:YqcI/YcgG family protein [Thermoanaerobaculia bacterium]
FHHALLDGWSVPLFLRELFALYDAGRRGTELRLAEAPPFRSHVESLAHRDEAAAERFWRASLAGFARPTPLPADLPGTPDIPGLPGTAARQEACGVRPERIELKAAVKDGLRALARSAGLTLSTLVQGAWAVLLSRWSGAEDVLFGTVSSGRSAPLPGIERMVGLLLTTLPTRVETTALARGTAGLLPWLRALQEHQSAMRQHEHSSLVDIQGWSAVPRGLPLFESLAIFENYPMNESIEGETATALTVSELEVREQMEVPLTLTATAGLAVTLDYAQARFDRGTAARMAGHLAALLEWMAAEPETPLPLLPFLVPAERRQALAPYLKPDLEFLAPRTPIEERVAAIWSAALAVSRVGVLDNFFALGGHSLQAIQVMAGLREAFPVALPFGALYEEPTVAGLAARVALALPADRGASMLDVTESLTPAVGSLLWTRPQIEAVLAEGGLPGWAREAYDTFKVKVLSVRFPCTFGTVAQQRGTLLYAFSPSLTGGADRRHIQELLGEYHGRLPALSPEEAAFTLLVLFVDPRSLPTDLAAHHQAVWDLLQFLHDEDPVPWAPGVATDPDNPLWSFCLAGAPLFVNISSPAHRQRRSRHLGSALTLVIQLRESFDLLAPDTPTGRRVRGTIRDRIEAFDGLPPYPELGYYKDPRNREWKQYGIPDGDEPPPARCPFQTRDRAETSDREEEI